MPEIEIVRHDGCSPVLDSYSAVDAMSNKEDLLSLNPTLFGSIPNEVLGTNKQTNSLTLHGPWL